jgi:hypothetical protein
LPPMRDWLRMYHTHNRVFIAMFQRVLSSSGAQSVPSDFAEQMWWALKRMPKDQASDSSAWGQVPSTKEGTRPIRRLMALMRLAERDYNQRLKNSDLFLKNSSVKQDDRPLEPEFLFFFRVVLPCWIVAKYPPASLLRQARQGDLDALDILLRIDKSLVHDTRISELIRLESNNPRRARFNRIAKSFSSFLPPLTKSKIKIGLISLISAGFSEFGGIDTPELRKLFDAYAHSRSKGKTPTDPDLPSGLEALSKAVQRGRKEWGFKDQARKAS